MLNLLRTTAEELQPRVVGYRRDFHKYAESGWTEFRTSSIIARKLEELGYQVLVGKEIVCPEDRMGLPSAEVLDRHWQRALEQGGDPGYLEKMRGGFTGVVGIISNGDGPVKALRFDIDALDIDESGDPGHFPAKEGFSSVNPGAMHACGHDCHGAVGLGVAEILARHRHLIKGTIKLIFQPAEEGVRGAKSMVSAGILDDVGLLVGHHVKSDWEVGELSTGFSDYIATKKFDVTFTGHPAHAGGNPQEGRNALLAASTAILNLYAISRHKDGPTRINVGKVTAGSGRNVVPDKVFMVVETRGATTEISEYVYQRAATIIEHAAMMQDCTFEITPMGEAQSGKSSPELMEFAGKVSGKIGGYRLVDIHKSGGSEDFTYMMTKVQDNGGYAVNLGVGTGKIGTGAHSHAFDVKEEAFAGTMTLLCLMVLEEFST